MVGFSHLLRSGLILLFIASCSHQQTPPLFRQLPPSETGIRFANTISENDTLNIQTDFFLYNGAGVGAADINNDGLIDLFFSGNQVSSRLYINHGNMQFEDITESAGVSTEVRATGVSMIDINADGHIDIYVSVSGSPWSSPDERRNLLFINNGDLTFTERAAEYNLDDPGFTTHTVFLDYNLDGYPDAYMLTNSPEEFSRGETGSMFGGGSGRVSASYDKLYRNNGDGTFTDVSDEAGIVRKLGYGLGVAVDDLNGDGYPDIYISNDITPNDVLYINNGDGTFTDRAAESLRHTSFAGMGIDIADFTNNGLPDIYQTDMMPVDIPGRKKITGSTTYGGFTDLMRQGFYPQYNMNTLQMNLGTDQNGELIFSEIARMAGVAHTDWSWSALFADLDNNGLKDLFVTNGYPKAVNDFDYLSQMHRTRQIRDPGERKAAELEILEKLHAYEVPNHLFRNNGDYTFTDISADWGMNQPGFSYGAVYADLNNSGRLDLVINNLNAEASVYENRPDDSEADHFLRISLNGSRNNPGGIGTKLTLYSGNDMQYLYQSPQRGFMSSVDPTLHFGLGESTAADSLAVIWPDGSRHMLYNLEADQTVTVRYADAPGANAGKDPALRTSDPVLFAENSNDSLPRFTHNNNFYIDYHVQSLLPFMVSKIGPPVAAADVTGNGLDDLFIGGTAGQPGSLFIQEESGIFVEMNQNQPWLQDRDHEDWGAHFFDANGDGLPDLYVASGGYHLSPVSSLLQDRLYINAGNGRFIKDTGALPPMLSPTASITTADITGNGMPDLFVSGRLSPRKYPHAPASYLLQNDHGRFTDITSEAIPGLAENPSMVSGAVLDDFTGDGRPDLLIAGEWSSPRLFVNRDGIFTEQTEKAGLADYRGLWFSVESGDFNGDGYPDFVAGNLGLNHGYETSREEPFGILSLDTMSGDAPDVILTRNMNGTDYPYDGLARIGRELYEIGLKFPSFESFSTADITRVFGSEALSGALRLYADTFAHTLFLNNGDGTFTATDLPALSQISPVHSIIAEDLDSDGLMDLLIAGNIYETEPNTARADAGNGLFLKGLGNGGFQPVFPKQSGFMVSNDVRDMTIVKTRSDTFILTGINSGPVRIFTVNQPGEKR
jgi:enediyne biosynthesis protein E4